MLKLLFSLEIVLLGHIVRYCDTSPMIQYSYREKSIVIRYNFNESLHLYNVVSNNSWMSGFQAGPTFPTIPTFPYFFFVFLLFPTFFRKCPTIPTF